MIFKVAPELVALTKEEVDAVLKKGPKSLRHVAARLFYEYLSKQELLDEKMIKSQFRRGLRPKLDPARIELIKIHLEDISRRPLSDQKWMEIKNDMEDPIGNFRRSYSVSYRDNSLIMNANR